MRPASTRVPALALGCVLAVVTGLALAQPQGGGGAEIRLLGFTTAAAQAELAAEQKLVATLSRQRLSEFHRLLTRRPHVAGTPGGQAVAEEIARALRSFGLAVETRQYDAWLSYPVRLRLRLVAPVSRNLPLTEKKDARDLDTGVAGLSPGFIAYSASGRARAPVVYVNYGLPADYEVLAAAGVEVRGSIVLARYGRVHRAVKVFTAEQHGARGILIYSDPADDGYAQGEEWPAGPWRAGWQIQRGNAKYSWHWHGDPLTPHTAATAQAGRLRPEAAPTLPRIPAAAISWSAAQQILSRLKGPAVPRGFQGALQFTYHAGPGPAAVELDVQMHAGPRRITNVLARIEGREEPNRWVILGTHHDAWTFGGVDPGSSAAVILELARSLGELRRNGWQPRRSILLAFWDAEEYGLIGSTEFAEERAEELREKAVAYVNSDYYLAGRLEAGGTASLRDFVGEAADALAAPEGSRAAAARRREASRQLPPREERRRAAAGLPDEAEPELEPLGSGADFVAFQDYLGVPALSLEFGIEGSYGAYHSNYDTRRWMEKFGDPGWAYGVALGELLGRTVMRLAGAEVLPLRLSHTAEKLAAYLDQLEEANSDVQGRAVLPELNLKEARERTAALGRQAQELEKEVALGLARASLDAGKLRRVNDHLARAEKSFVVEDSETGGRGVQQHARANGDVTRGEVPRWYRHTLYGWNIYALYSGQALPELHAALARGDTPAFRAELARLERALDRAVVELAAAARALR